MRLVDRIQDLSLRRADPGPDHVIGARHRKLTGVGGVLVVTAALVAIAGAPLGRALAASLLVPGPVLAIAASTQTSKRWFHRLGWAFLIVHGVVMVGLALTLCAAWRGGVAWNAGLALSLGAFIVMSLGLAFVGGMRPILEWRIAAAGLVSHTALLGFFLACPHAPHAGHLRWIMTAGVALATAGLGVWRHEIARAARTPLPTARTV